MSARSARKSILLTLPAETDAALRRYARARRARSLAGAVRSLLREEPAAEPPPPEPARAAPKPRRLRVQLEASLRARLAPSLRPGETEASMLAREIASRLDAQTRLR